MPGNRLPSSFSRPQGFLLLQRLPNLRTLHVGYSRAIIPATALQACSSLETLTGHLHSVEGLQAAQPTLRHLNAILIGENCVSGTSIAKFSGLTCLGAFFRVPMPGSCCFASTNPALAAASVATILRGCSRLGQLSLGFMDYSPRLGRYGFEHANHLTSFTLTLPVRGWQGLPCCSGLCRLI